MEHKLSIIIPCYNCMETLEEALASVYTQNLQIPFEVVMVDDGSTDGTWNLMQALSQKYKYVKLVRHKKNHGGGVTRNTAVANSAGDIIFCLDSDDILPPNMLPKMVECLDKNKCDGVVFAESRYFVKKPVIINNPDNAIKPGSITNLQFSDLFKPQECSLTLVNFLYTKESYYIAGGYPVNHGFDTQGFGCRYLAKGLKAVICPGSFYFHRQGYKQKSYFERVYGAGELSKNMYLIYEDFMHLFSNEIRVAIINFDIFQRTKLGENNLKSFLNEKFITNPNRFFIENYQTYLKKDGFHKFRDNFEQSKEIGDLFALAIFSHQAKQYGEELEYYEELISRGFNTKVIYFNILRSFMSMSNSCKLEEVEDRVLALVDSFQLKKQKINLNPNIFIKFINRHQRLKEVVKKITSVI